MTIPNEPDERTRQNLDENRRTWGEGEYALQYYADAEAVMDA